MLKIRREWRRTSSSQAEPSPWRHCWTSWASCSNLRQPRIAAYLGLHMMERKLPPKSSLRRPRNGTSGRILLIPKGKHKRTVWPGGTPSRESSFRSAELGEKSIEALRARRFFRLAELPAHLRCRCKANIGFRSHFHSGNDQIEVVL